MADVSLSAVVDTSGVAAGMASIENTVSKTANSIGSKFSGLFSAGVIVAEIEKITAAAETIHREAARFGIDAEQLQVVTNATKQLGLDIGQVARAMNLLEINAQKAIDPTTKQALAMEHLGIGAKTFAALSVDEKFFALADAYKASAQDGQAYADVAELIGKRNTEMIPLLAQGSKAIIEQGKSFRIMSNEEVDTLHALKVEQEKYLASLDGLLAQAVVSWGRYFSNTKSMFQDFSSFLKGYAPTAVGAAIPGIGLLAPFLTSPFTGPAPPPQKIVPPPGTGTGAPIGITDLSAGGGGGIGGGRLDAIEQATLEKSLNLSDRLNELLAKRADLQEQLNVAMEAGDAKAATQYQLQTQIAKVEGQIVPLQKEIAAQELEGVQAADLKIQKSQDRVALDRLDLQVRDALNRGDEYGAFLLQSQANVLQINLDFDEKIQKAINDANTARSKGLELTAQENELLAQQLETEKEATLQLEQQRQERERQRIALGPSPLTIGFMAEHGITMGATSDVYAAALAASRGIQPGTPEYERLVQQIRAQDELRMLQGKNLSGADQAARDKLVQWYAEQQAQKATQAGALAHQQEIEYWQAIAQGLPPPAGNPYTAMFAPPGSSPTTAPGTGGPDFTAPLRFGDIADNTATTNTLLRQILGRLTPVAGSI